VKGQRITLLGLVAAAAAASFAAGCGEVSRTGRAPAQLVIVSLTAASGAEPSEFGGTLRSDVQTMVKRTIGGQQVEVPVVFNDLGEVQIRLQLRDLGIPGVPSSPSTLNEVTINRYRVVYRRADGRNQPGVDVPYPFDSAVTFTVSGAGTATAGFEIVRHTAKEEAPLRALISNGVIISTIAEVTFYGADQAGNEVSVSGFIGISFGNFADPE